jgi:hypothetical protein
MARRTLAERVLARSTQSGDCLIWKGAMASEGAVPAIWHEGRSVNVRNALWLAMGKRIGRGQTIKAKCGEDLCVAPEHAQAHHYRSIVQSPAARANVAKAMRSRSPLTDDICDEIRSSEEPASVMASRHGVSKSAVLDVRTYRRWAPICGPFSGLLQQREAA